MKNRINIEACKKARALYQKSEYDKYYKQKVQQQKSQDLSLLVKLWQSFHVKEQKKTFPEKIFNYEANQIDGCHFVAAKGPANEYEFEQLLDDMLKNKNAKIKINDIVCLGDENFDFLNYISPRAPISLHKYIVSAQVCKDNSLFCETKLTVHFKNSDAIEELQVTQFKVPNGGILKNFYPKNYIKEDGALVKEQIKKIIDLAEIVREKMMLVHCMNGRGRTGHFILLIELFLQAEKLFSSNDPNVIAENAMVELNRIRKTRPSLISNTNQFVFALYNALLVHEFNLKQKNQHTIAKKPQSKVLLFAATNENKTMAIESKVSSQQYRS